MATSATTTTPTKNTSKRITSVSIRENAKRDYSPKWDGADTWTGEQFTRHYHDAMKYYNLNHSNRELKPKVIDWMGRNEYDKSTISAFKKTRDSRCSIVMGAIALCLMRGMPAVHPGFNKGRSSADWLRNEIAQAIISGNGDVDPEEVILAKKQAQVQAAASSGTTQDRFKEQSSDMSEEIDAAIDSFIQDPDSFNPKEFKLFNLLRGKGAKPAHVKFIKAYFQQSHNELLELASGKSDEQLREAYRHHPRKNIKKLIEFYDSIAAACAQISAEAKVLKKPRATKIKPAEELVSKLKFMLSDTKLGITSVPPAQIIGAHGVIVYNTITRKLGYYISKSVAGFGVKGTTLLDFSEKSTQKTLRKPLEQLKEFKEMNTQRKFETWFAKNITTTEVGLTGRFNEDTIILKVYK